jgi:RHS repeat-associated protein
MELLRDAACSGLIRLTAVIFLGYFLATSNAGQAQTSVGEVRQPMAPNRVLPKVEAPRATLEFSANPAPEEFFRSRVFEEPLVPVGSEPVRAENVALAAALASYAKRTSPDDFSSLTTFLEQYPQSPWRAALLTDLGLEYYNTAHYSFALAAWATAWTLARDASEPHAKAIADRAAGELAYMYARLGRMTELEALLNSVEGREFRGPATERISGARAGLSNMKDRPEIAFRCGPLALHQIKLSMNPTNGGDTIIYQSASTQKGFSLPQVADLANKVGLKYQMAFRDQGAPFIFPAVVHWKVGHYAAMIRKEGNRYLLQDPTFQNDVWATQEALEAETSGYFLVPPGSLPRGWREVEAKEGGAVWGKGNTCCNDPKPHGPCDPQKGDSASCQQKKPCQGMAISDVHLMLVSLNLTDEPVGYSPPVGPAVKFTVRYNQREAFQPSVFTYANFGPKWTFDWLSYITDNPLSPSADVNYYIMGGGTRTFTGFNPTNRTFAYQQFDQTRLTRTSASAYEMLSRDGSRKVFGQSDGSIGTSRKIFLTQLIDPYGNAVSLTYDASLRLVALTDAIGQVSTITYEDPNDGFKITKVTDPFGRFATFAYDPSGRLVKITDVIGLTSQFAYEGSSDFVSGLITPYGTTTFLRGESGTTRWLETIYPDGDRDRVEYNQSTSLGISASVPAASLPIGMATHNDYLYYRNTYFWSKIAYASTYPDYTQAKIYHWLHTADGASTAGILESVKEPLEGRVWYDYAGQSDSIVVGINNQPTHVGRVLDDGTTKLLTYEYDGFGHVTKMIDPVGRTFSYIYSTNGIDLLEVRQTRAGNNELLYQTTYDSNHNPTRSRNIAGQISTSTYNPRGQLLTRTFPGGLVLTCTYNENGYLTAFDGELPGATDLRVFTYDSYGRKHALTEPDGYNRTIDYDLLDRPIMLTYPDGTFEQRIFDRLDVVARRDRAGRVTTYEYNAIRQMVKETDPLNRTTLYEWCKCGDSKTITDPMGRTTTWLHDIQGRVIGKQFADGSKQVASYENSTSRLMQSVDENLQVTRYTYNADNSLKTISYENTMVATPPVSFDYDPNYERITRMTDGSGTTWFAYNPVTPAPTLGAGMLASIDGPLPNDTITFTYDALGRRVSKAINGVVNSMTLDQIGRVVGEANALGVFSYVYDAASTRILSMSYPNGQRATFSYLDNLGDRHLARITNLFNRSIISAFNYGYDVPEDRIATWSQQSGTQPPLLHTYEYDAANQLIAANIMNGNALTKSFAYLYDSAGNRLMERIDATTNTASYNTLNQLTTTTAQQGAVTNEWDPEHRLAAVISGDHRTEYSYDGFGRRVGIRELVNGAEISNRRFVWFDDNELGEERTPAGQVVKRFFSQGVKVETGPAAGVYFYTKDHLGSVRELTDSAGTVRARYDYDPYGRRTRTSGDFECNLGFTSLFYDSSDSLHLATYRAYDASIGRWLSRDPLLRAENRQGPNLYAYVRNDPVNQTDTLGLEPCGPADPGPAPGPAPDPGCNKCRDCDGAFGKCVKWGIETCGNLGLSIQCLAPPVIRWHPTMIVWAALPAGGCGIFGAAPDCLIEFEKCAAANFKSECTKE